MIEAKRLHSVQISLIRQILQCAPSDAINLALGELQFPLPNLLREKSLEILQKGTPRYTPNAGMPELRETIANLYPNTKPENVCVCNGVEEAIFVSLLSILNPGDKIAIPDPEYTAYSAIANILGAKVIRLPYESDLLSINWESWEKILAQNVKMLIFSHPSNPCGHIFTKEEAERLITICNLNKITMVVDEVYSRLVFKNYMPEYFREAESIFLLDGLSKSHCMSGWRIGWVISPPELSASVIKAKQYVSTCSNWLSQKLAVYALSAEGMKAVDEVLAQLNECRFLVVDKFQNLADKVLIPDATCYMMLKVEGDDLVIAQELANKGVVTVPGQAFGEVSKGWLRINYAVPIDKLEPALDTIINELYLH